MSLGYKLKLLVLSLLYPPPNLGKKKAGGGGRIIHLQIFLLYKCGLVEVIMMLTGADPAVCLSGGTKVFRLWIVDFKVLQPKGVSCLCKCF